MDDNQKNSKNASTPAADAASAPVTDTPAQKTPTGEITQPELAGIKDAISKSDTMQQALTTASGTTRTGTSDITTQMAEKIIKEQEGIIGPVAYEQATKVPGIVIDTTSHQVTLAGDKKVILESLVKQYEQLFGKISIAICKEAVRGVIANVPTDQVPQILL